MQQNATLCSNCLSSDLRENSLGETFCEECGHDMTDELREVAGDIVGVLIRPHKGPPRGVIGKAVYGVVTKIGQNA